MSNVTLHPVLSLGVRRSAFGVRRLLLSAFLTANVVFSKPISFTAALESREVRSLVPTTLSSAEINDALATEFMERSVLSARMSNAKVLQTIDDIARAMGSGAMSPADGELRLRQILKATGYTPDIGEAGTIKDFLSELRVDLIIRTNAAIAQGYGQFIQGQTAGVLDAYPCQELFRLRARKQERGWRSRWQEVGGKLVGAGSEGGRPRMIARKDDDIWRRLGSAFEDSLGNPYPPFAFGSGMWVKDVSRTEAVRLGVIEKDVRVEPQTRGFNDDLRFPIEIRSAALREALLESLGDNYKIEDGVLTHA